jgi:hypothetical protein
MLIGVALRLAPSLLSNIRLGYEGINTLAYFTSSLVMKKNSLLTLTITGVDFSASQVFKTSTGTNDIKLFKPIKLRQSKVVL